MALVELEIRDRIAIVTIDNPPVNALSCEVRRALIGALADAQADARVGAVVLRCAGRTFIAGADIREFDRGLAPPHTPDVIARIEGSAKPVLAAIHGTALGGGLEIALGCHYRIAADTARIGFPEVRLGLIPGAGGTQRLPRLVGIKRALDLMTSGRPISASEARSDGLLDAVVPARELLDAAAAQAAKLIADGPPLRRVRDLPAPAEPEPFFGEYRRKIAQQTRGQLAPELIIESVRNALEFPFDDALRAERVLFGRCLDSAQCKALRHVFFAERAAGKLGRDTGTAAARPIERIAIVGAGTMGVGIAYACLAAGYEVLLQDIGQDPLDRAAAAIQSLAEAALRKGRDGAVAPEQLLGQLATTTDLGAVTVADLVIEAVYESLRLKREVFAQLDGACRPGTVLATNTSTLDVELIANATARPQDVIGLHFFSPASVMPLIEIVRAGATSPRTVAVGLALAKRMRKVGVVVGNAQGFVGNRLFHSYSREAQRLLLEGAAPERIDAALVDWGMAMGPHAVGDLAGLDVGYRIRKEQGGRPDDPGFFRIADVLAEAGRYGQKTGAGMYRYAAGSRTPLPDPEVARIVAREAAALGIEQRTIDDREIVDRCIYALILEGARVLEQGIAQRASDVDAIWVNGYGFPRYRGGPIYHADRIGLRKVVATIEGLRDRLGAPYWSPPQLLTELARSSRRFADL